MKHIWVSTDWHLYNTDGGDIRHPFKTERIIQAIEHTFAQMIDSSDLFIFLGDLCDPDAMTEQELRRVSDLIHNIPGTKVMCRGNHDTLPDEEYRLMGFDYVTDLCRVHHMIFSHHPVRIAPDEINIHGHLHTDRYSAIELGHYQYVNAYGIRDEKTKSPYPILVEDLLDKVIDQHDNPEPDWGKKFESGFEKYTDLITCLNTSDDRILDLSNEILLVPEDDEPINESIGTAMVSLSASTEEDEKDDHSDDEILDEILFQDVDQTKYWEADDDSYQKHLDGAQYSDDRPTSKVHGKNDVIAERDPFINEAATAMKPPKIDETLEEILLLNNRLNQMKYGLHTKLGIKSDSSSEEFSKQYHVASPSEFLGHDGGVCWDFATYEDSYFITHFPNMKYKTWYIIFDDSQYYPTHTFLTFQYNGYHFYFESSFLSLQGVWYSKKEADLINFVLDGMNRHDSLHSKKPLIQYPYYVFQYDAGHRDIPGMDTKEFMDFVEKTGKRRRHKFTHNFRVNQLQFILSETANITQIRAVGTTLSHPGTENQRRVTKVLYQDGSRNIKTVMSFAEDILDGVIRIAPETLETERLKNINDIDTFVGYLKELNTHWGKISKGYPDLPKMLLQLASDTVGIKDAFPTLVPFNIKDEAMFRGWLDARIEELQDVEELLSDALMINLRSLVVNEVIAKQISETTDKKRHIKVLKTEIDRIRDNVTTKNRDGSYTIDYSAIQRGQVLISGSIYDDPEMNRVLTLPSRYVARLTMYDYIVVTHGTGENGVWKIDPVTYHGKTYTDPVKLLDKLTVNNQYVLLMACNPDGVELTNRYPTVDYADTTVLFESSATVTVTDNIADMPIKALISMKKEYLKHQIIVVNKLDKLIKKGVINDRYFLTPPDQITLIGGGKRNPILEKTVISVKTENDVMETYHRGFKVIFSVYKSVLEAMFIVLERASNIYHSGTTRAGDGYIVETFHNYSWCSVVEDTIVDPFHSFSAWIDKMYDTRAKEVLVADSDPKRKVLAESMDSIQDLIFMNEMCNSDSTAHGTDYVVRKFKNSICESTDTITSHEFENVHIGTDPDQPEVYFTSQITPDALVDIYHRTGFHGADALVKISSGEPGKGPRYCLDPDLIGLLLYHIHGTIGECNVGYEGPRYQTETHLKVLKDHGYTEIAPCDILDSMGEISLPVENGYHLKEFVVGSHLQDYGTIIVLSHFKGHPMAGFGGALKNVAIGFASSNGKRLVHSGGTTTSYIAGMGETNDPANIQEIFLQSMADGNAAFQAWAEKLGVKVLYINIANNISVDCDCVAEPEAPTMSDIGIFASYDPVAVDQACIDFVYGASDSQHVIERIEERHGLDLLEYAAEKNLGSRNYKLVTIDEMNEAASSLKVNTSLYFISKDRLDESEIIHPRIPDNYMTQHGYEDNKTPRVCFSTSIDGCLTALGMNVSNQKFYVYHPISDAKVITPTEEQVPDASITKERWICEPVQLHYIGAIKAIDTNGPHDDGTPYRYGKNKEFEARLYHWGWKWLNRPTVSRNISESASIPATLYHGSPKTFKVARVHDSGTSGAHLFATSMRSYALAYAGAEWSDFEINQSRVNGDMCLTEILPGKFREVFSRPGYLHILPADTFKSFHGVEFISDEDVRVQKTYKISNVLKELQKAPDVKLYYYPDLPPFIQDRERYLRDMAIKYNHNIDKILAMTKELRVEMKESTNPNDGQSSKAVELTFYLGNDKVGEAGISGYDTGAGFLYDLEVVERFRGKGYSKQILDYVMKNYSVTDLSVAADNKVAINLYEKFGFKLKKTFNSNGENGYEKGRFRWYQLDESAGVINEMAYEDYCDCFYAKLRSLAAQYNKRDDIFKHVAKVLKMEQKDLPKFDCHIQVSGEKQLCFSLVNSDTPFEIRCEYEKYLKEMIEDLEKDTDIKTKCPHIKSIWTADAEGTIYVNLDYEYINEAIADTHPLDREQKKRIADKYGLRAVGQVDADEEEERRKTPEQRLEEKRKKQLSTLKKARKVKKRKAMVRKIKSHLPFKSQNEDTAVDDTDVPGMEVEDNPLYGQRKHFFYNYDMPKQENVAVERLSESTSETTVLYHGSPMSLDVLKANSPLVDNKGKHDAKKRNVLYASPDKIFSLAYAGGHWTDLEINQSIVNDKMVLTEIVPGALDKAFNRPGYLYELSRDGFTRLNPYEFYSLTDREPIKKTRIPNVMKALKKEGVEFYRYPNLPEFIPSRYEYLKDRCDTFGIDLDTTISMTKSAGATDLNLAIQESYKFELNNKQLHFVDPISESTTAKNEQLYPVYVMLVHSGTTVSNVIKTVSKSEYSHASISFDSSMRQMYSFARKDPNNPFIGGFRYETIGEGFYEKKEIPYAVYVVPCTESQIKKMKKRLAYFEKNKDKFTFDFSGLVTNYLGIVNNPAHRWFCSRFVSDILNAGTKKSDPYVPEPSLMDPDDFKRAVFAHYVTSGKNLMRYDTKKVDKITRKILREERMKRMAVTENVIFNLDFNDPYTETVIGYQLAMMDESVVNQFLDYLKSFHVRLDKDGNVILTRRVYTELDHHFHQTQKMLKMEKKSGDIEGMKLNLAKLHYMVGLIDEQYLKNRTVSRSNTVRKDMIDLRSVMMNTFQHYLKYIEELDPSFNFQSYYDSSIYGKETKIPLSVVTAIGKSFKTLL